MLGNPPSRIPRIDEPKVRLPGVGGAPEIAASAREVIVVLRHNPRAFVEKLDFVTSVGHRGGDSRAEFGYPGDGPTVVITDLGVLRPDPQTKQLNLVALHPGQPSKKPATGWELAVADTLGEEMRIPREKTGAAKRGDRAWPTEEQTRRG